MAKLCERPGCSNPGEAAYGMVAEELLFWLAPIDASQDRAGVLCRRHADAMVVPRGWTLDDRRNGGPRLFQAERFAHHGPPVPAAAPRHRTRRAAARVEQLVIDGTGEIARPAELPPEPDEEREPAAVVEAPTPASEPEPDAPWLPKFDTDDDLGGVLDVRSPLLSRAFRGTDLRR
jgi:hypothetical protein